MSEAYCVMSGDGMVTVDGETAAIHAGDAIPVDLGQSKSFTVTGNAPLELLVFGIARYEDQGSVYRGSGERELAGAAHAARKACGPRVATQKIHC